MDEAVLEQFAASIDRLESDLMQHVRTSALKKERETLLINEMLGVTRYPIYLKLNCSP